MSDNMNEDMFNDLLKSVKEAEQIIKGTAEASRKFEVKAPDIKKIRSNLGLPQQDFAYMIGVSVDTLQNWEQERRAPHGPALALLTMFKNNPKAAFKILHSSSNNNSQAH